MLVLLSLGLLPVLEERQDVLGFVRFQSLDYLDDGGGTYALGVVAEEEHLEFLEVFLEGGLLVVLHTEFLWGLAVVLGLGMGVEGGIAEIRFAAGTKVVSALLVLPGPASAFLLPDPLVLFFGV